MNLIDTFFPKCSVERENPYYKCGSPMQLYDVNEVRAIESTESFKAQYAKVYKRKIVARESANKKREELAMYANEVQINIPDYQKDKLIKKACDHYNSWNDNCYYWATPSSNETFLKRICINYLRHQCTCYDKELEKFYKKVGVHEAHNVLQNRINEAIKQKYEWLR